MSETDRPVGGRPPRSGEADDLELAEFAQGLRALRATAGLKLADLAKLTHYSPGALSDATSGKRERFPSWELTERYVEACAGDVEAWCARWEAVTGRTARTREDDGEKPPIIAGDRHAVILEGGPMIGRRAVRASVVSAAVSVIAAVVTAIALLTSHSGSHSVQAKDTTPAGIGQEGTWRPPPLPDTATPTVVLPTPEGASGQSTLPDDGGTATTTPAPPNAILGGSPYTTYLETVGVPVQTWSDPQSGGGLQGSTLQPGTKTWVLCRVDGFQTADGNSWWYHLMGDGSGYYASADAFYNNGRTSGSLKGTPFFDPAVPVC
jgi:transcriptional regulator with XRE-family HTH domain